MVLVAGGSGNRFQSLKQFEIINGKPTYLWFLETFLTWPHCGSIVVVVPLEWEVEITSQVYKYQPTKDKNIKVVRGGSSRQASATAGFQALVTFPNANPWVMIHDAARPCASLELIGRIWDSRQGISGGGQTDRQLGGVIPGLPVRETIKKTQRVNDRLVVCDTPQRNELYTIQTPQLFDAKILGEAYGKFPDFDAADDSTLVENLGFEVIVVPGEYDNLKITFREDIERVSSRLRQ